MKVIIDAQLPFKLTEILNNLGFKAMHVESLPLKDEMSDIEIVRFADVNNITVITKDFDFYHSHMISKSPEKLLLITTGNIKNNALFSLFRNNHLLA